MSSIEHHNPARDVAAQLAPQSTPQSTPQTPADGKEQGARSVETAYPANQRSPSLRVHAPITNVRPAESQVLTKPFVPQGAASRSSHDAYFTAAGSPHHSRGAPMRSEELILFASICLGFLIVRWVRRHYDYYHAV